MPRRDKKARRKPRKKGTKVRLKKVKDDSMSPGRIVACAEYVAEN